MNSRAFHKMDRLAGDGKKFLFILDFDLQNPLVLEEEEINPEILLYDINGRRNYSPVKNRATTKIMLTPDPVSRRVFNDKFNLVKNELKLGNTYLLNLTFETPVILNESLRNIFMHSKAYSKLWLKDHFVLFSPEPFVSVKKDQISTFPMKGTIDASVPDAGQLILKDSKESAEHATIVDMLRNDISRIAENVRVERYRYLDRIDTGRKTILQVSSEIRGRIMPEFTGKPGSILRELLPAGSITGAPRKKTVELIKKIEDHKRGFYTGVCGYYDGDDLFSAVMIRFIEKRKDKYFYKSGGGITFQSDPEKEYNEYLDKIYVPVY